MSLAILIIAYFDATIRFQRDSFTVRVLIFIDVTLVKTLVFAHLKPLGESPGLQLLTIFTERELFHLLQSLKRIHGTEDTDFLAESVVVFLLTCLVNEVLEVFFIGGLRLVRGGLFTTAYISHN